MQTAESSNVQIQETEKCWLTDISWSSSHPGLSLGNAFICRGGDKISREEGPAGEEKIDLIWVLGFEKSVALTVTGTDLGPISNHRTVLLRMCVYGK